MTMHIPKRQPFAALDTPRLQTLANIKNRQNAITASLSAPAKPTALSPPVKRRYSPSTFDDDFDAENVDPASLTSPSKRAKNSDDGTLLKKSAFVLTQTPPSIIKATPSSAPAARIETPTAPLQKRKASASPTRPLGLSGGRSALKHKRISLLSKRRVSSSPIGRIDPPTNGLRGSRANALPFSIDAALSGTIPSYTPKTPSTLDESPMPRGWFFAIHEDSPEEEAANMMEHNTGILDISSDDDSETRRKNEASECGKENIPPPDALAHAQTDRRSSATSSTSIEQLKSRMHLRQDIASDVMTEAPGPRSPLSDLPAADYYAEGLDASSVAIEKQSEEEVSESLVTVPAPSDNVEESLTETPASLPVQLETADAISQAPAQDKDAIVVFEDASQHSSAGLALEATPANADGAEDFII